MKKISYFYNDEIQKTPPTKLNNYSIIFSFIPTGEDDYISCIQYFKENLKGIENKKVILIAEDEGVYGSYIDNFYHDTFFELLEEFSKNTKNKIYLISHNIISNQVVSQKKYTFEAYGIPFNSENYLIIDKSYDYLHDNRFEKNLINNLFLSYNRGARIHRIYLHYKLHKLNLKKDGIYFWHSENYNTPLLESIYKYHSKYFDFEFLKSIDFTIKILPKEKLKENTILLGQEIIWEDYNKSFLSLVTETEAGNDTVYFSEKIFKPIATLHPFILVSSPNSLKELKKLGYKTFDKWWDESYDLCDNLFDRINKICDILLELKNLSNDEMFKMRLEMKEVLNHNYETYKKRSNQNFLLKKIIEINNQ